MTQSFFKRFSPTCITALLKAATVISAISMTAISCRKDNIEPPRFPDRIDNVFIMYSAGHNNLSSYLREDIDEFCRGYIPKGNDPTIFLSYQKLSPRTAPTMSYLIRYYSHNGRTAADTIAKYPADMPASHAETLNKVLSDINDRFPSPHYAMLFSSHASGWLPKGYYAAPEQYDNIGRESSGALSGGMTWGTPGHDNAGTETGLPSGWIPYSEPERDPTLPPVKSIGQDVTTLNGTAVSYELDLKEFSDAIPIHLDYIFFDCCLMGGIEVAYELRDKCDMIIFSPAEVLASGFNYRTMGRRLFASGGADLKGVCEDYYNYYNGLSGAYHSATVTLVDCRKLEPVAGICRQIFSRYKEGLSAIDPDSVQRYYTGNHHWFYDLYDMAEKAGAVRGELEELDAAINGCILYRAATDTFLIGAGITAGYGFEINTYSGFSTYLPCNGSDYLDEAYRSLDWNTATGMVS